MTKKREILLTICGFMAVFMSIFAYTDYVNGEGRSVFLKTIEKSSIRMVEKSDFQENEQTGAKFRERFQSGFLLAANTFDSGSTSSGDISASPLTIEQLRSAEMGLEAFRVFCAHFQLQDDQSTLASIKKPAMDYIKLYIDPILARKQQMKDDAVSLTLITIGYLKSYIYYLFDDAQTARKILMQIRENLPPQLNTKTIYNFEKEKVTVESALLELEKLIAGKMPES